MRFRAAPWRRCSSLYVAVTPCAKQTEARRAEEKLTEAQTIINGNEERLKLDTAKTLAEKNGRRLRADAKTGGGGQERLAAEERRRWPEKAKVAMLTKDIRSLSLTTHALKGDRQARLGIFGGSGRQLFVQKKKQPGTHRLEQLGFESAISR